MSVYVGYAMADSVEVTDVDNGSVEVVDADDESVEVADVDGGFVVVPGWVGIGSGLPGNSAGSICSGVASHVSEPMSCCCM